MIMSVTLQIQNVQLNVSEEEKMRLTPEQAEARNNKKYFRWRSLLTDIVDSFRHSKAASKFIKNEPDEADSYNHMRWSIACVMGHPYMTMILTTAVLFNSILMGLYADEVLDVDTFTVLKITFVCIFAMEISLKLFAFGQEIYFEDSWNILDFAVVSCAIIESVLEILGDAMGFEDNSFSAFLRILGIFRIARLISALKELEFVVRAFVLSMGSAFWVNVLTILCLYILAVLGRIIFGEDEGLAEATAYHPHGSGANGKELFGSIMRGMATMLQIMTMNWAVPTRIVSEQIGFGWFFFVFSMVFLALGVFNLYTAIYVEKMRAITEEKEHKREQKKRVRRKELMLEVGDLLNLMDTDRSGTLDRSEMEEGIQLLQDTATSFRGTIQSGSDLHRALSGSSDLDFSLDHIYLAFDKYLLKNRDEDLQIPYREFLNTVFTMHDNLSRNEVAIMHSEIEDRLEINTRHIARSEAAMDDVLFKLKAALQYV